LALVIIVDKAISIQRKVGYLQVMEEGIKDENIPSATSWKWEFHLEDYRGGCWAKKKGHCQVK